MKKQIIGIAISDLHFHKWKDYNPNQSRLELYYTLFAEIEKIHVNCPIFFSGDLFHEPESLDPEALKQFSIIYNRYISSIRHFVCIAGNHDQKSLSNGKTYQQVISYPRILQSLLGNKNFKYIGDGKEYTFYGHNGLLSVRGIDYVEDATSFESILNTITPTKKTILLTHQNFPDSKDPSGYRVTSQINAKSFSRLNKFGLVLNGHVHKYHKHSDNVYTVGATHQQRVSDMGCKMGGLIIYSDLSTSRFYLLLPEFSLKKDGYNFYVAPPEMDEELRKDLHAQVDKLLFSNTAKPTILAKKYLKAKGIKSKAKAKILIKYLK